MIKHFCVVLVCAFTFGVSKSQIIPPSSDDLSVVYFVRISGVGSMVNFSFYDSTLFIGKIKGGKYIRYECQAGKHLFLARSENDDFLEAELSAGKIYFVDAYGEMGGMKARVLLEAVDTKNPKWMKKILKLINKKPAVEFTAKELAEEEAKQKQKAKKAFQRYHEKKKEGKEYPQITPDMFYLPD